MNLFSIITSYMIVCYTNVGHATQQHSDQIQLFTFSCDVTRNTIQIMRVTNDIQFEGDVYCYWYQQQWNTNKEWVRLDDHNTWCVPRKGVVFRIPNVTGWLTIKCKRTPGIYDYDASTGKAFPVKTLAKLDRAIKYCHVAFANARNVQQNNSKPIQSQNRTDQIQTTNQTSNKTQSVSWDKFLFDPQRIHSGVDWNKHGLIFGIIFVCIGIMFAALVMVIRNYFKVANKHKLEMDTVVNRRDTLPKITDRYCIETEDGSQPNPNTIFKFDDFPKEKIRNLERAL